MFLLHSLKFMIYDMIIYYNNYNSAKILRRCFSDEGVLFMCVITGRFVSRMDLKFYFSGVIAQNLQDLQLDYLFILFNFFNFNIFYYYQEAFKMKNFKKIFATALLLVLAFSSVSSAAVRRRTYTSRTNYNYGKLASNYQEFKQRYNKNAKTPRAAVKLYFEAVFAFTEAVRTGNSELQNEAGKMIRYAMHYDQPIENSAALANFVERLRDPKSAYIFRSFLRGTSPSNNYTPRGGTQTINNGTFAVNFVNSRPKVDKDALKVLIKSSGASESRPVWVKRFDDGLWYATNISYTYAPLESPINDASTSSTTKVKRPSHDADYD